MRDYLPRKPRKNESAIVNLEVSAGGGTHWVCYMKIGDIVQYYDSFGVGPPQEVINYFGDKYPIYYNCVQIQKLNQIICGHLCLEWLNTFRVEK